MSPFPILNCLCAGRVTVVGDFVVKIPLAAFETLETDDVTGHRLSLNLDDVIQRHRNPSVGNHCGWSIGSHIGKLKNHILHLVGGAIKDHVVEHDRARQGGCGLFEAGIDVVDLSCCRVHAEA